MKLSRKIEILATAALLMTVIAEAVPAYGPVVLDQPDGSAFAGMVNGDEWMKIITDEQGRPLCQDGEGWWCYARFDADGTRHSTGVRLGDVVKGPVGGDDIPFATLAENARKARSLTFPVGENASKAGLPAHPAGKAAIDADASTERRALVILAQYKDLSFKYSRQSFENLLNQSGYSLNGATGSAMDYFNDQFGGRKTFRFDVAGPYTLPQKRAYYGANDDKGHDLHPDEMIIDACKLADADVNFADYAQTAGNEVDNVFVFYCGEDESDGAAADCIWSHSWYIYNGARKTLILDGVRINRYACTSELRRVLVSRTSYTTLLAGIGTFCHEFSHTLGLQDMYDTDYEGSGAYRAAGLWRYTSLMDSGNGNNNGNTPPSYNAIDRELAGIAVPQKIKMPGTYTLGPIDRTNVSYRLDTDDENEYYILEYRSGTGWDRYTGGSGMLVYHIDKSTNHKIYSEQYARDITAFQAWTSYNSVNAAYAHQCADLIEADGRTDKIQQMTTGFIPTSYGNPAAVQGLFYPTYSNKSLSWNTKPALTFWSGAVPNYAITDINKSSGGVTFTLVSMDGGIPVAENVKGTVFQDAAIVQWNSDRLSQSKAYFTLQNENAVIVEDALVEPYDICKYSFTPENLQDGTDYVCTIYFKDEKGKMGQRTTFGFKTRLRDPRSHFPYIYMQETARNDDGSVPAGALLPLRVFNAADVTEVDWKLDGRPISVDADGWYHIADGGLLEAIVHEKDGACDIIRKNIVVK